MSLANSLWRFDRPIGWETLLHDGICLVQRDLSRLERLVDLEERALKGVLCLNCRVLLHVFDSQKPLVQVNLVVELRLSLLVGFLLLSNFSSFFLDHVRHELDLLRDDVSLPSDQLFRVYSLVDLRRLLETVEVGVKSLPLFPLKLQLVQGASRLRLVPVRSLDLQLRVLKQLGGAHLVRAYRFDILH